MRLQFGYHTGQHSKVPVKLAPSFYTAVAKCLEQETVNAVELESAAHGCVHQGIIDEWRLLASSKSWYEAELSIHVKTELLGEVSSW